MCLTLAGYCSCQQNVAAERIQQERIHNVQKDPKEGKKGEGFATSVFGLFKAFKQFHCPRLQGKEHIQKVTF